CCAPRVKAMAPPPPFGLPISPEYQLRACSCRHTLQKSVAESLWVSCSVDVFLLPFEADAGGGCTADIGQAHLLPDLRILSIGVAGLPDFSAISRSCCSKMVRAGASRSMPPSAELGTLRLDRREPSW